MMYETILARSFSKHDQKKLGYGAFLGCLIVVLSFCSLFKHLGPLPVLRLSLYSGNDLRMLVMGETDRTLQLVTDSQASKPKTEETESLSCHLTEPRSDFCELTGDIRIESASSTIFMATPSPTNTSLTIRPYARKGDSAAMSNVEQWSIKQIKQSDPKTPKCSKTHTVPAVLFSAGAYAGNHFHAFSDIVIPLYLSSFRFHRQVQFLVSDVNKNPSWTVKFREILKGLSEFDVIDIDKGKDQEQEQEQGQYQDQDQDQDQEQEVHCFKKIKIGLEHHKELGIKKPNNPSMTQFRQFLRTSYSLNRQTAMQIPGKPLSGPYRPRMLIISRKRSRAFKNLPEIADMARDMGFEVLVSEAEKDLARFARVVNSCDVFVGVHGAGMTNMVFLPEEAVVVQVVPLGRLEWLAETDYGAPAKEMGMRYLEYGIGERESTLVEEYSEDDVVLRDPSVLKEKGWEAFKAVYMENQNVSVDLGRFRPTLVRALELLYEE